MENRKIDSHQYNLFDQLEDGKLISQDVLDSIKKEDQQLFEILQISNQLRSAKKVQPDPFFSRVSQIRVYYRMVKDRGAKVHIFDEIKYFLSKFLYIQPPSLALRPVLTILLVIALSFSVFVGGAQAADNARPGQFLYPVDLAIEKAQLFLTFDEQARLELHLKFAEERLLEAKEAFTQGEYDNAGIALAGYEKAQQSIYAQLGNQKLELSKQVQNSVVDSHHNNTKTLSNLLVSAPQASKPVVLHAIEVSDKLASKVPGLIVTPPVAEAPSQQESQLEETLVPLPSIIDQQQPFTTVWASSINVHSGPGLDHPVIGWLFMNQTVESDVCMNGFLFIPEFSGWAKGTCFDPNPCGPPGSCLQITD